MKTAAVASTVKQGLAHLLWIPHDNSLEIGEQHVALRENLLIRALVAGFAFHAEDKLTLNVERRNLSSSLYSPEISEKLAAIRAGEEDNKEQQNGDGDGDADISKKSVFVFMVYNEDEQRSTHYNTGATHLYEELFKETRSVHGAMLLYVICNYSFVFVPPALRRWIDAHVQEWRPTGRLTFASLSFSQWLNNSPLAKNISALVNGESAESEEESGGGDDNMV